MTTYPQATWKPVPNHGGPMTQHLGLVLHVQEGNGGLQNWFSQPNGEASSTWWVSKSGLIEQYVDADLQAWAQSQGNATYNSVETEGYTTEALTDSQIEGLASIYQWGNQEYGWPYQLSKSTTDRGFAWHGLGGTAWGNHPGCPGDLRKGQMNQVIQLAGGGVPTPVPPKPPITVPAFPYPNDHYLGKPSPDPKCHSGYYGGVDTSNVKLWQSQMAARGWTISVDGKYGDQSTHVCTQFQSEKHLSVDGLCGPQTWEASWLAPIT